MKELQPTNPVSEQESQTASPVNEQDIEDRINQFFATKWWESSNSIKQYFF